MTEPTKTAAEPRQPDHSELLACIEASQAGAVQERVNALMQKFPELQGAMQLPPPPELPPEGQSGKGSASPSKMVHKTVEEPKHKR